MHGPVCLVQKIKPGKSHTKLHKENKSKTHVNAQIHVFLWVIQNPFLEEYAKFVDLIIFLMFFICISHLTSGRGLTRIFMRTALSPLNLEARSPR
jgi:hypothetical protein